MAVIDPKRLQLLVEQFADSTIQQTEAIRRGDPRAGNKEAARRRAAFQELRRFGDVGRDALVPLFDHPRADVREMVAAYLLRHKTAEALEVLRREAAGTGLIAFGAQQAIKRWEEGNWNLDPLGD